MNTLYGQPLLFPDRAENLGQYSSYDVDLAHWRALSALFRETFEGVFERGASAVLIVHGGQGTGKTLFSRRLAEDFEKATYALCLPPSDGDLGGRILDLIQFVPSIAKPQDVKKHGEEAARIDAELRSMEPSGELTRFGQEFVGLGQQRSLTYERAIMNRLPGYGRGFASFPTVKPDFIVSEYQACAVTAAASRNAADITAAIRRGCHAIEFTAHLQGDMAGLKEYLLDKASRYGILLESV